jgi:tetratricopeptide (TPR) repeat protein
MIGAVAFSLYSVFGLSNGDPSVANASPSPSLKLDNTQKSVLLREAAAAYQHALQMKSTDAAEAQTGFVTAAQKYQTLVDSGIHNAQLYFNLGNAYVQSDSVGRAIANYRRALRQQPWNYRIHRNLDFALSAAGKQQSADASVVSIDPSHIKSWFANLPPRFGLTMLAIGWIGLCLTGLIMAWRPQFRVRYLAVPAMIMVMAASGWIVYTLNIESPLPAAIAIANDIPVYEGSSEAFPQLPNVKITEGDSLQVIQRRGDWLQIRSSSGDQGWTKASLLEQV